VRSVHTAGDVKRRAKPLGGDFFGQYSGNKSPDHSLELYSPVRSPVSTPLTRSRSKGDINTTISRGFGRSSSLPAGSNGTNTPESVADKRLGVEIPSSKKFPYDKKSSFIENGEINLESGFSAGDLIFGVDSASGSGGGGGPGLVSPVKSQMRLDKSV
jgi:hypothetical protein